ncbi:MAG: hypothetical protein KJ970_12425 [Candidatus Eisenbacteria bacterium]|uniref:Teichoic acid biosynthesis protein n=1 Tax=Eiseniibacteriota bacterium TaxID=2212470 RepID=A0A948RY51_UNCEI|nr:hypothetical protein [Candidatus Eisenbacteria bacterium]MBU2691723.1 hypothetical protein [Candidatus Eisenbacteria bacterium]
MARIIYGVQGEGRGHSSRSKIIIEHLLQQGHDVKIFTSHKGYDYLSTIFDDVTNILGLGFVFDGGKLDISKTLQQNLQDGTIDAGKTMYLLYKTFKEFQPHLAITDFEPFVPYLKGLGNIPFLSINHQHIISQYHLEYPYKWRADYLRAKTIVDNMYWFADHYYVTSFYYPRAREMFRKKSTLIPPILRNEVQDRKLADNGPILIYATTTDARMVLDVVQKTKYQYIGYGFDEGSGTKGNITFKKTGTGEFLDDLASAAAVVTNGGYTLMSEAICLGKPVYSIPIRRQFEQMVNGYYLEKLGFGLYDLVPIRKRFLMFLEGLPYYRKNMRNDHSRRQGNTRLFKALDRKIEEIRLP